MLKWTSRGSLHKEAKMKPDSPSPGPKDGMVVGTPPQKFSGADGLLDNLKIERRSLRENFDVHNRVAGNRKPISGDMTDASSPRSRFNEKIDLSSKGGYFTNKGGKKRKSKSLPSSPERKDTDLLSIGSTQQKRKGVFSKLKHLFKKQNKSIKGSASVSQPSSPKSLRSLTSPGLPRKLQKGSKIKVADRSNTLQPKSGSKTRLTRLIESKKEQRKVNNEKSKQLKPASMNSEEILPKQQREFNERNLTQGSSWQGLRRASSSVERSTSDSPRVIDMREKRYQSPTVSLGVSSLRRGSSMTSGYGVDVGIPPPYPRSLKRSASLRSTINAIEGSSQSADRIKKRRWSTMSDSYVVGLDNRHLGSSVSLASSAPSSEIKQSLQRNSKTGSIRSIGSSSLGPMTSSEHDVSAGSDTSLLEYGQSLMQMMEQGSAKKVKVMPSCPEEIIKIRANLSPASSNQSPTSRNVSPESSNVSPVGPQAQYRPSKSPDQADKSQAKAEDFIWSLAEDGRVVISPKRDQMSIDIAQTEYENEDIEESKEEGEENREIEEENREVEEEDVEEEVEEIEEEESEMEAQSDISISKHDEPTESSGGTRNNNNGHREIHHRISEINVLRRQASPDGLSYENFSSFKQVEHTETTTIDDVRGWNEMREDAPYVTEEDPPESMYSLSPSLLTGPEESVEPEGLRTKGIVSTIETAGGTDEEQIPVTFNEKITDNGFECVDTCLIEVCLQDESDESNEDYDIKEVDAYDEDEDSYDNYEEDQQEDSEIGYESDRNEYEDNVEEIIEQSMDKIFDSEFDLQNQLEGWSEDKQSTTRVTDNLEPTKKSPESNQYKERLKNGESQSPKKVRMESSQSDSVGFSLSTPVGSEDAQSSSSQTDKIVHKEQNQENSISALYQSDGYQTPRQEKLDTERISTAEDIDSDTRSRISDTNAMVSSNSEIESLSSGSRKAEDGLDLEDDINLTKPPTTDSSSDIVLEMQPNKDIDKDEKLGTSKSESPLASTKYVSRLTINDVVNESEEPQKASLKMPNEPHKVPGVEEEGITAVKVPSSIIMQDKSTLEEFTGDDGFLNIRVASSPPISLSATSKAQAKNTTEPHSPPRGVGQGMEERVVSFNTTSSPQSSDVFEMPECALQDFSVTPGHQTSAVPKLKVKKNVSFKLDIPSPEVSNKSDDLAVRETTPPVESIQKGSPKRGEKRDQIPDTKEDASSTDVSASLNNEVPGGATTPLTSTSADDISWWGPEVIEDLEFFHDHSTTCEADDFQIKTPVSSVSTETELDDKSPVLSKRSLLSKCRNEGMLTLSSFLLQPSQGINFQTKLTGGENESKATKIAQESTNLQHEENAAQQANMDKCREMAGYRNEMMVETDKMVDFLNKEAMKEANIMDEERTPVADQIEIPPDGAEVKFQEVQDYEKKRATDLGIIPETKTLPSFEIASKIAHSSDHELSSDVDSHTYKVDQEIKQPRHSSPCPLDKNDSLEELDFDNDASSNISDFVDQFQSSSSIGDTSVNIESPKIAKSEKRSLKTAAQEPSKSSGRKSVKSPKKKAPTDTKGTSKTSKSSPSTKVKLSDTRSTIAPGLAQNLAWEICRGRVFMKGYKLPDNSREVSTLEMFDDLPGMQGISVELHEKYSSLESLTRQGTSELRASASQSYHSGNESYTPVQFSTDVASANYTKSETPLSIWNKPTKQQALKKIPSQGFSIEESAQQILKRCLTQNNKKMTKKLITSTKQKRKAEKPAESSEDGTFETATSDSTKLAQFSTVQRKVKSRDSATLKPSVFQNAENYAAKTTSGCFQGPVTDNYDKSCNLQDVGTKFENGHTSKDNLYSSPIPKFQQNSREKQGSQNQEKISASKSGGTLPKAGGSLTNLVTTELQSSDGDSFGPKYSRYQNELKINPERQLSSPLKSSFQPASCSPHDLGRHSQSPPSCQPSECQQYCDTPPPDRCDDPPINLSSPQARSCSQQNQHHQYRRPQQYMPPQNQQSRPPRPPAQQQGGGASSSRGPRQRGPSDDGARRPTNPGSTYSADPSQKSASDNQPNRWLFIATFFVFQILMHWLYAR